MNAKAYWLCLLMLGLTYTTSQELIRPRLNQNKSLRYINNSDGETIQDFDDDDLKYFGNSYSNSFDMPNSARTNKPNAHLDIQHKKPRIKVDSIYHRDPSIRGPQVVDDYYGDSVISSDTHLLEVTSIENSRNIEAKNNTEMKGEATDTIKSIHDINTEHKHSFTFQDICFSFVSYFCVCSIVAYIIMTKFPTITPKGKNLQKQFGKNELDLPRSQTKSSKHANFSSIINSFVSQHRKLDDNYTQIDESMFSADASSR